MREKLNIAYQKINMFCMRPIFKERKTTLFLWIILALIGMLKLSKDNNFKVFRGVFWHTINGTSLYAAYPKEYFDYNYYGPIFSMVVAPFALLPEWAGLLFWLVFLSMWFYWVIWKSTLTDHQKNFIYWFCAPILLDALFMQQFNVAIAAIIVSSFFLIEKEKDGWAALFIVLGTMTKIYGVMGLAFFFFSKHKGRFILSLVFWTSILFVLPMLISSPEYVIQQYQDWLPSLVNKNGLNTDSIYQNVSLLGMARRISGNDSYSDLWLVIPGMVMFLLPYLRFKQIKNLSFRETILASTLMFTILFSTGSESSGYIIAMTGICIWYTVCRWKRDKWDLALMIFVFIITGMGNSDILPRIVRKGLIQPYALRALPVSIVWFKLCYELYTKDYARLSHNDIDNVN